MTQRRTPSGQRPARRPAAPGRRGGARTGVRDAGARGESRGASARTGTARGTDAPRSASRPAAARRAAAGGAAKRTSAPQPKRFTGRATALIAVLIALALAYTYPVRIYLNQQSEIARTEAAVRAQANHIDELSQQAAKWQDDEYVRIQARERFYMVYPGEAPLVVLSGSDGAARAAGAPAPGGKDQNPNPWYDTLWSSIQAANDDGGDGKAAGR
jgi:cell division protein FtsB